MPARNEPPDMDLDLLSELRDIMGKDFPALVMSWQRDADARLTLLDQALKDGNAAAFRQTAHSLKGSSANLGARDVVGICQQLELLAGEGDLATAGQRLEVLRGEVKAAGLALEKLVH